MSVWIVACVVLLALVIHSMAQEKKAKNESARRQEFIDKHLFVVEFPSQRYVFPFVWGTRGQKVFFCTNDPRLSPTPRFDVISKEEAKERITKIHQDAMEEMERMGV